MTIPPLAWLRPHPCTLPPPDANSLAARGITCTLSTFLVSSVPATYPYLPFRPRTTATDCRAHIPFFSYSGPDPPPTDIGCSPGDTYVAPTAGALYAFLPVPVPGVVGGVVDGVADDAGAGAGVGVGVNGAWTRWTAINPDPSSAQSRREVKLGDPGLVPHPVLPRARAVGAEERGGLRWGRWGVEGVEGASVDVNVDVEETTRMLVKRAVEPQAEGEKGKGKGTAKKGKGERRRRIVSSDGEKQFEPPKKRARASLEAALPSTSPGPEPTDWDAFYAKPRNSTRGTKEMREQVACDAQAAAIVGLEAENAALRGSCDEQAVTIARWGSEDATFRATVNNHMQKEQQKGQTAPERMPFHPEFLRFMRETFACEVMRTCNAQRVAAETAAADARLQTVALEAKVAQLEDENAMDVDVDAPVVAAQDPTPNTHLDAARARGGLDYALPHWPNATQLSASCCAHRRRRRRRQKPPPRGTPHRCATPRICVSDQERKIASLEAVVTLRESTPLCPSLHAMLADDNYPPVTRTT
ncbi:hypothetical protein B0H14DRAFT_3452769 [Mycena olivaceomarginata]|nr:hypothetical protein B0H14DRAFT_3452769 [Mycena olivaceomarginata]